MIAFNFFPSAAKESKPMFGTKYMQNMLSHKIRYLDDTLCSLGKNAAAMLSFLKLFGIDLGIDFFKNFDISKPIDPADHFKYVVYCGMVAFLCYIGISKRPSPLAHRLAGVAVLSAVMHFLWIPLSGVPRLYQVVFFSVCAVLLFCRKKMTT